MIQTQPLPDPDDHPAADVVIYDGQCNFCKRQVLNLSRLDCCGHRLAFISLHDPRVSERYPALTFEELMKQMYVVPSAGSADGGPAYGGADAVRYLSRRLPLLWPVAPLLHLPGTARLWQWGYHQIAKRRYSLAGKSAECDNDGCSIHLR